LIVFYESLFYSERRVYVSLKKLLITKSQRNLLLYSEFIKSNDPEFYKLLNKYEKISYQTALEENMVDKIKQSLSLWLDFSSKEWIPDKKNPRIGTPGEEAARCQLCNTQIKFRYKIKNKLNDCILIIGGNCVDTFQELKTMKKIVSNENEFKRYTYLLEYNPYIYDILMTYTDILERTKIILPYYYEKSFKSIQRKVTKIIRAYIKNGKSFNDQELNKLIYIHKKEIKNINEFVDKHVYDKSYLSREKADFIKSHQKEDFPEILNEVKENGGKLLAGTSIKLKIESYLEEMREDLVKVASDSFVIERASYGVYYIEIKRFNDGYKFSINSRLLLTEYYRNKLKSINLFYEKNLNDFKIYDSDTQEKLVILAESFITKNKGFQLKEIDLHKIVKRYDNDLDQKEYSQTYNKVSNLANKYTLIEKSGEAKLFIYNNSKLSGYGKKLLFNQSMQEINELIDSYEANIYVDDFYDFIISQIG